MITTEMAARHEIMTMYGFEYDSEMDSYDLTIRVDVGGKHFAYRYRMHLFEVVSFTSCGTLKFAVGNKVQEAFKSFSEHIMKEFDKHAKV